MRRCVVMMHARILAAVAFALYFVGAPRSASAQGSPCPTDYKKEAASLPVSADAPVLVVTLTRAPITRLRLSLDQISPRPGKHVELEWEPNLPDTLVKSVVLAEGTWNVSFWAEPILRVESYSGQSFYVEMNLNCFDEKYDGTVLNAKAHIFNALPKATKDSGDMVTYAALGATLHRVALPDMVSASNLGAAGPLYELREVQGRGLADPLAPGVQEVFQLLAEIALERAKSRGIQVLRDQLREHLCEKLTWGSLLKAIDPRFLPRMSPDEKETLEKQTLLPRTCSVIESLRLQDLASSGRTVLRALREDFARSVVPFFADMVKEPLGWNPELTRVYDKLVPIAVEVAAGNRPTKEQARLLLIELSRQDWIRDALLAQLAATLRERRFAHDAYHRWETHGVVLERMNEELRDLEDRLTSAKPRHRVTRPQTERDIAAKKREIERLEKEQLLAEEKLEEVKATHSRLEARIRLAFALYDELRQADLIAPAMQALNKAALKEFVIQRYAADKDGERGRITSHLVTHLNVESLRRLVPGEKCDGVLMTIMTRAQLMECVRKQPMLDIQALRDEDMEILRHMLKDILPVRSWVGFETLKNIASDARKVVFREMVARAIELNLDLVLQAAGGALLREVTLGLLRGGSRILDDEQKRQLRARLGNVLGRNVHDEFVLGSVGKLLWDQDAVVAVGREYAAFLNGLTPTERRRILRDALTRDFDGLVAKFVGEPGGCSLAIKLDEAIEDPQQIVARLTVWGLCRVQKELAEGTDLHPAVGCGLQLAFAVLSKCVGDGSCTTNQLSEIFREPHAHFKAAAEGLQALCWDADRFIDLGEAWPDLDIFASKVVTVFFPEPGATGTEMATAAADVFFDVAMRLACRGPADRCRENEDASKLQALHSIVHAMLQHDVGTVLVETSHLAEQYLSDDEKRARGTLSDEKTKTKEALHKATELVGAIAAYASTFDAKAGDAEALAAAREARKRAIESLIDTATDRRGRHGDTVWSIGANVGFSIWGQQFLRDARDDGLDDAENQWFRLQLPMGIAVQHVWDTRARNDGWRQQYACGSKIGCGFHAQISLVDLGQFLASSEGEFNEVTPRDFLTVGLQAGWILGSPSMPFVIGADVRWAPSLFPRTCENKACGGNDYAETTRSGVLQWGFFASYYVPFLDIN
jgi:hypothetical protein